MAIVQKDDNITADDIGARVNTPGLGNALQPEYIAQQATMSQQSMLPTFDQFLSGEYTGIGSQRNLNFVNMNISNLPSGVIPKRSGGKGTSSTQVVSVDDLRKSIQNTPKEELGNSSAFNALRDLYSQATQTELYSRMKNKGDPAVSVPIAGVDMASGQIVAGEDTDLGEFAKSRLGVYDITKPIGDRIKSNNPNISSDYVTGVLVNKFSTGNIYEELFRGVKDVARLPMYTGLLAVAAKDAALASTPFYTWQQGQGGRARAAESLRKVFEDTLGSKNYTVDSHLNNWLHDTIKKDLIKREGSEEGTKLYNENFTETRHVPLSPDQQTEIEKYRALTGGSGNIKDSTPTTPEVTKKVTVPIRLLQPNEAQTLLDVAFDELPFYEKFGVWASQNLPLGGGIASVYRSKAKRAAKDVSDYRDTDPTGNRYLGTGLTKTGVKNTYYTSKEIEYILARQKLANKKFNLPFENQWWNIKEFIGKAFGTQGKAALGESELRIGKAIKESEIRINKIYDDILDARARGLTDNDLEIKKLYGEMARLNEAKRRNIIGFNSFYVPRSPLMSQTFKDESIITLGMVGGYQLGTTGAEGDFGLFGMSTDVGMITGGITSAFRLHTRPVSAMKWVGSQAMPAGRHSGDIFVDLGTMFEDILGMAAKPSQRLLDAYRGSGLAPVGSLETAARAGKTAIYDSTGKQVNPLRGIFINNSKEDFFDAIRIDKGRPITLKERENYSFIFQMTENLSTSERGEFFDNLTDASNLQERIVSKFPAERQAEAIDAFRMSLATASNFSYLKAAALMLTNSGKLNPKNLKKGNFSEIKDIVLEKERNVNANRLAISQFERVLTESNLSATDNSFLNKEIRKLKDNLAKETRILSDEKKKYSQDLDDWTNNLMSHPSNVGAKRLEEGIFSDLLDSKLILTEGVYDAKTGKFNAEIARGVYEKLAADMYEAVADSFERVQSIGGTTLGRRRAGLLTEKLAWLQQGVDYNKGRMAYKPIQELLRQTELDIGDFANKILDDISKLEGLPIDQTYSHYGKFWNGAEGKMLHKTMEAIAGRAMKKKFGKNFNVIREWAKEPYGPEYNMSNTELYNLIRAGEVKAPKGSTAPEAKLNFSKVLGDLFTANFHEMDELRRHFARRAAKLEGSDKEKSVEYARMSDRIDLFMKKQEALKNVDGKSPLYAGLKEARARYKANVFDKNFRQGGYGSDNLDRNVSGPVLTDVNKQDITADINQGLREAEEGVEIRESDTSYLRSYKRGNEPENWHDGLAKSINDGDMGKMNTEWQRILYYYGDLVDSKPVFDLSKRSDRVKLKALKHSVESTLLNFYMKNDKVADAIIPAFAMQGALEGVAEAQVSSNKLSQMAMKPASDEEIKGYLAASQKVLQQIDKVQNALTINVKGKDSPIQIIDLKSKVLDQRDVSLLMRINKTTKKAHDNLESKFKVAKEKFDETLSFKQQLTSDMMDKFAKLTDDKSIDPKDFYDNVMGVGGTAYIVGLRESNKQLDLLSEDEFDNVMLGLLTRGFIEQGGPAGSGVKNTKDLNGRNIESRVFTDLKTLNNQFENEQVRDTLIQVFATRFKNADGNIDEQGFRKAEEQFNDLQDIVKYLRQNDLYDESMSEIRKESMGMAGVIRPISTNEVISRAFNLARGMVSPAYVTAEMAVRIASAKGIDILGVAIKDPDAAKYLKDLLNDPFDESLLDRATTFAPALIEFVITEIQQTGGSLVLEDLIDHQEFMSQKYDTQIDFIGMERDKRSLSQRLLDNFGITESSYLEGI